MSAVQAVFARWFVVMLSGWLMSCSWSRPTVHKEPILPPDFSQNVEKIVQSLSHHENVWPETVPGVSSFAHRVKWQRETLFSIALWYTGSGENWKRLADANPSIKPKQIHIGDTIHIPKDLLKRRQVMPSGFLKPTNSTKRKSPPQHSTPSPKTEQINLYGPIGNDSSEPDTKNSSLPVPLETID